MKTHGLLLYLSPQEVIALAELQAKNKLGRSFAGKLALTEGFHQLGVLSDEDYEEAKAKYSVSLIEAKKKLPTVKELQVKAEIERLEKHYSEVLKQWSRLSEKAKLVHLKKAKKDAKKVQAAKLILDLAQPST